MIRLVAPLHLNDCQFGRQGGAMALRGDWGAANLSVGRSVEQVAQAFGRRERFKPQSSGRATQVKPPMGIGLGDVVQLAIRSAQSSGRYRCRHTVPQQD